jgi:hypothetical protein
MLSWKFAEAETAVDLGVGLLGRHQLDAGGLQLFLQVPRLPLRPHISAADNGHAARLGEPVLHPPRHLGEERVGRIQQHAADHRARRPPQLPCRTVAHVSRGTMASSTRCRVSGETSCGLLNTLLTVDIDTPADSATCRILTRRTSTP